MPTWHRTQAIYEQRRSEVVHRYGKRMPAGRAFR